jgi:hypothetical protein
MILDSVRPLYVDFDPHKAEHCAEILHLQLTGRMGRLRFKNLPPTFTSGVTLALSRMAMAWAQKQIQEAIKRGDTDVPKEIRGTDLSQLSCCVSELGDLLDLQVVQKLASSG